MRKVTKIICVVVALMLSAAMLLTGCVVTPVTPATPDTPSQNNTNTAPQTSAEAVELVWYLVGPQQEPETDKILEAANSYLKDKLNVKVNLTVLGYGDPYNNKINTMLAAGDRIDICFTAGWAADIKANSSAGYFRELDSYLAKSSTITDIVGQAFMDGIKINGKTYAVPCRKEQVHNWGFIIQKALADKYNVNPQDIKTMEDLEPVFASIKKNEPDIYPLLVVEGEAPFKLLDWDPMSDDSIPGALYPDNRDNKIINQFLAPESIAMYKKMRDYMQKGYIPADAATMQNFNDHLKTGKYFAICQSMKPGKAAEMTASTSVEWLDVNITAPVMANRDASGGALLAIPTAAKFPDQAFSFIEMLYTDKYLNNLFVYGIENEHYTKVSENVVKLTDNTGYRAGNGWRFGDQFLNYLMDNEDPNKWEQFTAYNKKGFVLNSLGFSFDRTPVDAEHAACRAVTETYYKQLFTGSVDVDATIKLMEAEYKAAGVDILIAEMQRQYDAWLATK
ncbi:MAG: ABC transporter substrate-binding protein [Thermoclostridium sp.]|nr:ABC transporter substrate-binding protein [Thermoclostridium sp.]